MESTPHIDIARHGTVAVMTLRHEEQNRFTTPFLTEVCEAWDALAAEDDVRGVVVTGAQEKFFSTGIHLEWLMAQGSTNPGAVLVFLEALQRALVTATGFPKPLVGALNGHVVAGGAILAACFDYRLMRDDYGFVRLPEVQIDIPFTPGMVALLQGMLPAASFRDLALTGDRVTGAQARAMGYVDELVPAAELVPRAVALAAKLGAVNLRTYAAIKRSLKRGVLEVMERDDPPMLRRAVAAMVGEPAARTP